MGKTYTIYIQLLQAELFFRNYRYISRYVIDLAGQNWSGVSLFLIGMHLLAQWQTMVSPTQLCWRYHSLPLSHQVQDMDK